jgi:hypothetical protein
MLRAILSVSVCILVGALAGCGSDTDAEITNKMSKKDRKTPPEPTQILVYDFATSPNEVSADGWATNRLQGAGDDPDSNPQRTQLEHQIAGVVAEELVEELRDLDLPARRWSGPAPAGPGIYNNRRAVRDPRRGQRGHDSRLSARSAGQPAGGAERRQGRPAQHQDQRPVAYLLPVARRRCARCGDRRLSQGVT